MSKVVFTREAGCEVGSESGFLVFRSKKVSLLLRFRLAILSLVTQFPALTSDGE